MYNISPLWHEAVIAFCGPLFNLIAFFVVPYGLWANINLAMLIINLCPVLPLDGGRMVFSILAHLLDPLRAHKIMRILGNVFAIAFIIAGGVILFLSRFNASLLIIGGFLFCNAVMDDESGARLARSITGSKNKFDKKPILQVFELSAIESLPARKILSRLPVGRYCLISVISPLGKIVGRITETQLVSAVIQNGASIKLKEILKNS